MPESTAFEGILLDALDNISEAFVIYDKDGYLVTCNAKFRELYSYTEENTHPGVHFLELGKLDLEKGNIVVGDEFGSDEEYLKRKSDYRETLKGSFIVQMMDGRWIKTTDRPLTDGGFVSVQSDITEIKRNEAQLLRAKENAELANRAKSDFIANMSHELRTPLNAIIGFSSLLTSEVYGLHSDPRYKEYAADVEGAGSHLLSLINELLDLAKIESGDFHIEPQETDVAQVTGSCKTMLSARASERNIRLHTSINPPDMALMVDPIRLKQILVNLAGNAVKFSHPGGQVSIEWTYEKGRAVLTVTDEGVGIEKEFMPYLFHAFKRSRIAKNLHCEGTGLGLALVKRFSDAHNARLTVDSIANKGTTVRLAFPVERNIHQQTEIAV